jgi:hypothetical protein
MKADDIRRLYRAVDPAMAQEAAETANEARTDPVQARRLIKTLYSLSVEDRAFAMLLRMFLEASMMRLVEEHAEQDDAFALDCAKLITDLMERMTPPARGRARPAKSA